MKVMIVGTGSIGQRHIHNIKMIKPSSEFIFVRKDARQNDFSKHFNAKVVPDVECGLSQVDCVVVATPSAEHIESLEKIIKRNIPCYIEKPVVSKLKDIVSIERLIVDHSYTATSMVGCNLRFMPALVIVKNIIKTGKLGTIIRASLEAGQWLPDWRKGKDYREVYSAKRDLGGGVILDLIHEIDLAMWLFNSFKDYKILHGKLSNLEIDTEDVACILLDCQKGPLISLNLDYVSRFPTRIYKFVGVEGTLVFDLYLKKLLLLRKDRTEIITSNNLKFNISQTYVSAMKEFIEAVDKNVQTSQDICEGLRSAGLALKMIEGVSL